MRSERSIIENVGSRIKTELKFAWNLVDPRHSKATVYVSRETGEIVNIENPQ